MSSIYDYLGWPQETVNFNGHLDIYNDYTAITPVTNIDNNSLVTGVMDRGKVLLQKETVDKITDLINKNDVIKSMWM